MATDDEVAVAHDDDDDDVEDGVAVTRILFPFVSLPRAAVKFMLPSTTIVEFGCVVVCSSCILVENHSFGFDNKKRKKKIRFALFALGATEYKIF